jgi:hypothetical protein
MFLTTLLFGTGAVGAQQQKTPRENAPALNSKLRQRLAEHGKTAVTAKRAPARLAAPAPDPVQIRSLDFAGRAVTGASKAAAPDKGAFRGIPADKRPTLPAEKLQGGTFVGRHGTGLGDINEQEPNDSTANVLDDIPVNVVGYIEEDGDFDYYAITATQGESIRIEVIADRFFETSLDSYLIVLAEDGETQLEMDDDHFSNSNDSFIRFDVTRAGTQDYFIGVTDFRGEGGDNFGYVLNVTVAEEDFLEVEPNDTTSLADFFPVPAMAFGFSDNAEDLDVYVFDGVAGQALIADVDAEIFLSLMDPVIELYDDNGGYLFGVDDADGLDPRFNIILPYSGEYFIVVYNAERAGGNGYYYTMNLSTQSGAGAPRVTGYTLINPGQLLKRVNGSGFTASDGGSNVEIESVEVSSRPAPRKPTSRVKLTPPRAVSRGDVLTVVNPDGRRSNPGIIQ